MFNRYFVLALISTHKQYLLAPTCLFLLIILSQNVHSQQQIAEDAYGIFQQSCLICHGPDGAYRETLLMEHNTLIQNGTVVPGNPDASELYKRLITTENAKRMPLGQPQLSTQAINTIRNWILAGAPDWAVTSTPDGNFISSSEVLNTIENHLNTLTSFDRAFARYFTLTHLHNAGEPPSILQEYRKGLNKLVNSLSWGSAVTNPQPIDPQGTILYIDLRHYEWDANDGWTTIESEYPYHIPFDAPDQSALKQQFGRLQQEMKCDIPSVHADWFIAKASLPPLYHDLLSLPFTDRELETRLEVDVIRNILNAPGVRVWRAGTNNSGVSNNNRVIERHTSQHGAYWKSYDFAGSVGTQNIFTHPLSFTHDGGEVVFNLPNGLQGYYVTNATGFRLDAAPINIVSNPAASDPTVRNGLSCFGCHTEGMKTFEDQVRPVIESNATPAYDKEQALRLYVEQSKMDALVKEDMDRYKVALEATGGVFGDIEPISRFHEVYQDEVDLAYAAAVVGLAPEAFLEKIRANIGLQNVGLLVLDSQNGSIKRDTWTSNFIAMIYALDFPEAEVDSPSQPDLLPGGAVHIPDTNLHAAIAEALGKSPNATVTSKDMEKLSHLDVHGRNIQDLTGLQYASNLGELNLGQWWRGGKANQISDISPIAGLINLHFLLFDGNPVSDLSPVTGLINLERLEFNFANVSDLSPVTKLVNLRHLGFSGNNISDLSPVAGLINLETSYFMDNNISDLSPVAGLINLEHLNFGDNRVSDISSVVGLINLRDFHACSNPVSSISSLAGLTKLEKVVICGGKFSDLTPLSGLTGLKELSLVNNGISDISPLAGLTGLTRMNLAENNISDVSPLAGLTNLKWLGVYNNKISDISPLDKLREHIKLDWHGNPAFPTDAPKIEGPWLWVTLPYREPSGSRDLLSEASGGTVTEVGVATHGAIEGEPVGDDVWTFRRLPPVEWNNVERMLGGSVEDGGSIDDTFRSSNMLYGTVSLYSPRQQDTTMYVGSHNDFQVWLNGTLIYESLRYHASFDYTDFLTVTLQQGRNVLLVAVRAQYNAFFGFEEGTEYTVSTGIGYTFSKTPIHIGDTFTLDIRAENISDLAGWQFDLDFDPTILEAISVTEGDFLKADGVSTFFHGGSIDNAAGKIKGLNAARLSLQGATGTGTLLQVTFKAKALGETQLTLQNFQFGSITGDSIPAGPHEIYITVAGQRATGDVNGDGVISILDMVLVVRQIGQSVPPSSPVDLNGDGMVDILDLIVVAQGIAGLSAASPAGAENVDAATIEAWIAQARLEDDGSIVFKQGIEILENLLASLIPEKTALLANYPNPFNPETWIPYQLAESAEVTLTIYDMNGRIVRRLTVGHQAAGVYQSRIRAAYWDGRNQQGESVASGLYFYTLTADNFTATRKMLILK